MKNNILKYGLSVFFTLFYTLPILAQDDDPGTGGGWGGEDDPAAPIDNWILGLIIAGITLGAYFLLQYKRRKLLRSIYKKD